MFDGLTVRFNPADCWVGAHWQTGLHARVRTDGTIHVRRYLIIHVCVCPMLPLKLAFSRPAADDEAAAERLINEDTHA